MTFQDPTEVEQVCFQMKLSDFPRGRNRARINDLFNGVPPFTAEEVAENNIVVNVNFLEGTGLAHEARSQFTGAFLKPGSFFNCTTDFGSKHKCASRSQIVTKEVNRVMKRSLPYLECFRSKFALNILHGVGPSVFRDSDRWCPQPVGIDDVYLPANTLLTMDNVPFFAIYRSYTVPELIRLTKGPKVDPAWNIPLVEDILKYVDKESMALMGTAWPDIWSPEKASERVKSDGGYYAGDKVPTVDCWDFYFWNDDNKEAGWNRRMILDAWSTPSGVGNEIQMTKRTGDIYDKKQKFLYNPEKRKFADKMSNIINFQFADLSAVGPFRYHSVRSLGFLLYATCHLQNRMRCKFNEAVFEALLMYFRVKSMDDAQRALKVELASRGFIDETLQFIPASERFQVNTGLVELGINENRALITKHSASYTTTPAVTGSSDNREKTRYQVMAEIQNMTALISMALNQAYEYQKFEYLEIFRRFCKPNSIDPDVREFQARCVKQDVPLKMISEEQWEIEPERVMGAGNKTLEMTIAEQLMQMRPLYDPSAQREILRDVTAAITDDPARAAVLVPEQPEISNSVHDAQLRWGSLMALGPVVVKDGTNHGEVVETLLGILGTRVIGLEQQGQLPGPKELAGFQNVAQNISQEIEVVAQDKNESQKVSQYGQELGRIMNLVKAFGQRLEEQMKKRAESNGGGNQPDPKDLAKAQAIVMQAQVKAKASSDSHAQKTAQRQITFQQKLKQDTAKTKASLRDQAVKAGSEMAAKHLSTRQDLRHKGVQTKQEIILERRKAMMEAKAKPPAQE